MRTPKYISPSSLSKFESDRHSFYTRYLCDIRTERPPQADFMAVGSAFDGFTKSAIHVAIHGEQATKGTPYEKDTIFEKQVEPHVRDVAMERGTDLFNQYVECGAYPALLKDIEASPFAPEMEFDVTGTINSETIRNPSSEL